MPTAKEKMKNIITYSNKKVALTDTFSLDTLGAELGTGKIIKCRAVVAETVRKFIHYSNCADYTSKNRNLIRESLLDYKTTPFSDNQKATFESKIKDNLQALPLDVDDYDVILYGQHKGSTIIKWWLITVVKGTIHLGFPVYTETMEDLEYLDNYLNNGFYS